MKKSLLLFCNVAEMKYYGLDTTNDHPQNGGSYVQEKGDAFEKINFHDFGDPCYYGFVETGGTLKNKPHQIHLEKIDSTAKKSDSLSGVTVVFCTKSDFPCKTKIVGWYQNATVYRNQKEFEKNGEKYYYFFKVKKADSLLLEPSARTVYVPRCSKKRNNEFGFGQSNVWFAQENKAGVTEFRKNILNYIKGQGKDLFYDEQELFPEDGTPRNISVTARYRSEKARAEYLRQFGCCCKICGFSPREIYGKEFEKIIEVHHIVPISDRDTIYQIDINKDLIGVCPNCHRVLHKKRSDGTYISVKELKEKFKK